MHAMKKGILFDFNGTMFFDGAFQEASWRAFLEAKTGRAVSDAECQEYIHGRNADVTLRYFLQRELTKQEVAALEEEKEQVYRRMCLEQPDSLRLAAGLPAFLDRMTEQGVPMTIATAAGLSNIKFYFEQFALHRWFSLDRIVYNDGTIPGKPKPDIYQIAAQKLQVTIHDCVVFEDARAGIEAARRAGVAKIIGISSMLTEAELLALGADAVIPDYCGIDALCDMLWK